LMSAGSLLTTAASCRNASTHDNIQSQLLQTSGHAMDFIKMLAAMACCSTQQPALQRAGGCYMCRRTAHAATIIACPCSHLPGSDVCAVAGALAAKHGGQVLRRDDCQQLRQVAAAQHLQAAAKGGTRLEHRN
jgi:hypothetical protein